MSSRERPVAYSIAWDAPWLFGCVILLENLFNWDMDDAAILVGIRGIRKS